MRKIKSIILVCVLGFVLLGLTGCGGTTIDLNKYISIEVEGYDSMGQARCTFDYDEFEEDYADKIKAKIKGNSEAAAEMQLELSFGAEPYEVLLDYCTDWRIDKSSDLSNGDIVEVTWDCEDELAKKYFNCSLKYSDIEYKVKNLGEVGTFNPFDSITVEYSGLAPNGNIIITSDKNKPEMQYISFNPDRNGDLSNGDRVTVTADIQGDANSFVGQFGVLPSPSEQEFTVEGLEAYVTSSAEIDESTLNAMKKQAEDAFTARWIKADTMVSLKGLTYIGYYLLNKKEGVSWGLETNRIYLVYKVDAEYDGQTYSYYHFTKFSNLMVKGDGSCSVVLSKYETASHIYDPTGSWTVYFYGYESVEELYRDCVQSVMDAYTYEDNVKE